MGKLPYLVIGCQNENARMLKLIDDSRGKHIAIMNYLMSINRAKAWPDKNKADVLSTITRPHFKLKSIAEGILVI
jgi:hypothetical protein